MRSATVLRLSRRNVSGSQSEFWRPPVFEAGTPQQSGWPATVRRFFDIQAASIWRDLARVLPTIEGTIIDVGCGAQPYRPLVPPGALYRGIDSAETEAGFEYAIPDVSYFDGDVWPVDDASADLTLCTEVLEHVVDPTRFLEEARRCLRPGGTLLLTVPFAARWHYIPRDYWRFTPSSLALLLGRAGFSDVRVYQRGNPVTVAAYKTMAVLLPIVLPQSASVYRRLALALPALLLLPVFVALALVAQVSLAFDYGDDCLGYTVFALKAEQ